MRYLDRFTGYVREYEKTYPLPAFDKSIQHIEAVGKQVEEKLKDVALGEPNPELVQQTIEKFFDWASTRTTKKSSWLEVALLCRGLLVDTPENGTLIKSRVAFKAFLGRFFRLHQDYVMSAYCWQGLFNAYLNISPRQDPSLTDNWQELRMFLQDTLDTLADQSRFKPHWLDALIEHRIVLAENATQSLAQGALQGQMGKVRRIAKELEIPATSWFWPDLLMSQVAVVIAYSDEAFKLSVNLMLTQLKEREECLDEGLSKILDRYAQCTNLEPHQELKSMAVSLWKSPSLEKQRDWERVSPEAKRMVQRWLAQEDITEILGELVEDNRRYEFWLQFLDQIDYTFVWLGNHARESFPHLLQNRKERCAKLNHPGKPDNNVILMKIHDVFIIESGAKAGGKCWAYREDKIQIMLKKNITYDQVIDNRKSIFSNKWGGADGLVHVISNWEDIFLEELNRLNIKPDAMSFNEIIHRYQLHIEKLPSGWERIEHAYSLGILANLLRKNKFSYNFREGFYYRDSRELSNNSEQGAGLVTNKTSIHNTMPEQDSYSKQYKTKNIKVDNQEFDEILGRHQLRVEIMAKGWERVRYHESNGFLADLLRQNGFEFRKDRNYYRSPRTK